MSDSLLQAYFKLRVIEQDLTRLTHSMRELHALLVALADRDDILKDDRTGVIDLPVKADRPRYNMYCECPYCQPPDHK